MTIGQRLRAAREAKEMSIGDISRRTFIQPKFIQAIDEDNLGMMPDSHRRLFIREYAKMVGVDPDEVLAMLAGYEPPPPPPQPVAPKKESAARQNRENVVRHSFDDRQSSDDGQSSDDRRSFDDDRRQSAPAIEPMPESERKAYSDVMRRLSSGRGIKLSGSNTSRWLIGGAIVLLLLVGVYYAFFHNSGPSEAGGTVSADSTSGSPTEILSRSEGGDSAAATGAPQGAADDSLTLEGRTTDKVWYTIVMDGPKSDGGTLDSGVTKTWRAAKFFKLSLGNAGGLQLTLNGKPIGTLGPKRTSVSNQVIDADGPRKSVPSQQPRRSSTPDRKRRTSLPSGPRTITSTPLRTTTP
jgi:cytoskeletal protein RodZ